VSHNNSMIKITGRSKTCVWALARYLQLED